MVSALYGLALRAHEACKLRWSDFSVRGDGRLQLRVVGKGGRTATILVPAWVWDCFIALPREGDRIFHLTENSLWIWFKRLGVRAGINPAASPHWMRHSNAVHSITNGCPIDVIRETLRHANISTTSHYLRAQNRQSSGDFLNMG